MRRVSIWHSSGCIFVLKNVIAVVGEDANMLISLAHHTHTDLHDAFFYSDKQGVTEHETADNCSCRFASPPFPSRFYRLWHNLQAFWCLESGGTGKNSRTVPSSKPLLTSSSEMTILKLLIPQVSERLYWLYNGSSKESLDELRYRLFCSKVVTGTTCVHIHSLSTTSAALFHSLRVDFQVQEWQGDKLTV